MGGDLAVGVVGVGNIGTVHLQSLRAMDGVAVPAVADPVRTNRQRARSLGVARSYEDAEAMVRGEALDAVVVAVPPSLHVEVGLHAIDRGCHVFVEKPFATTPDAARELASAAERAGVAVGVDHTLRYLPEVVRLRAEYETGRIGHVPLAVASRVNNGPFEPPPVSRPVSGWQLDPDHTGGGALMDLGVHLFDVLESFFGPLTVRHAELGRQLDLPYEDTASVVVRAASGTLATLNCGFFQWERPPAFNHTLRLDGVAGTLDTADYAPKHFMRYAAGAALENVSRRARGREPDYYGPTYYYRAHFRALADFVEAVRAGRPPPVGAAEGVRSVELVHEAYAAAERTDRPRAVTAGEAR